MISYLDSLFSLDKRLQLADFSEIANYLLGTYNIMPNVYLQRVRTINPTIYWIGSTNKSKVILQTIIDKLARDLYEQYDSFTAVLTEQDLLQLSLLHPAGIISQLKATVRELHSNNNRLYSSAVRSSSVKKIGYKWQALDTILNYWTEITSLIIIDELSEFYNHCEKEAKKLFMFNKIGLDLYAVSKYQTLAVDKLKYLVPKLKIARKILDSLQTDSTLAESFAYFIAIWSLNKHGIPMKLIFKDSKLQQLLGLDAGIIKQVAAFLREHKDKISMPYLKQFVKQNASLQLQASS